MIPGGERIRVGHTGAIPEIRLARRDFANQTVAMDRLFDVFPDKYPVLIQESSTHWVFRLDWPRQLLQPIDPLIDEKSKSCFGLDTSELGGFADIRWIGRVPLVFSMFHSWALLAPVYAVRTSGSLPDVVVHVDAHHDLASTLLTSQSSGALSSNLWRTECRLSDPMSIQSAIDSGLINKANFLTAFILASMPGRLFHIDCECFMERHWLKPVEESIEIGDIRSMQTALEFERMAVPNAWTLLESNELPKDVGSLSSNGIWLDVDLDAFCNRFDGDSDNGTKTGTTPEHVMLSHRIDVFLKLLSQVSWRQQVSAVSVAASPGFFPSEYWDAAIPKVIAGIASSLK